MPRLTITVPTYNRAHLLDATLRSVLNQSFSDFELFVSDNASTDHTGDVVAKFNDPRITYLRGDENRGHYWNLSRGLHLGSAPLVAVLPDDDAMLPGNLEKKVALLDARPELGLVHSAYTRVIRTNLGLASEIDVYTDGKLDAVVPGPEMVGRILRGGIAIAYPAAVIRRAIIDPGDGFEPEDKGADDVALSLRLAAKAGQIGYLAEPLVQILLHEAAANLTAGGFERAGNDFVATVRSVCDVRDAKLRFLARHDGPPARFGTSADDVRKRAQEELLGITRIHLEARDPAREVARRLMNAVRADPGVLRRRGMVGLVRSAARESRSRAGMRVTRISKWAGGRPPVGR